MRWREARDAFFRRAVSGSSRKSAKGALRTFLCTDAKEKGATHSRRGAVGLDVGHEGALPPAEPLVVAVHERNTEIGGGRLLQRHLPPSREALEFGTGKYLQQCIE